MLLRHVTEPSMRLWSREEFYELAELGYFRGQRVQLVEGEIIQMAPQGEPHSICIMYLNHWAVRSFGDEFLVRVQLPLNASDWSDPEPDIAIVPGPLEVYRNHPRRAPLIIEVSDSSVQLDRRKAKVYAEAEVPEYWLVNIPDKQVEVYRAKVGAVGDYDEPVIYERGQTLSPVAWPRVKLVLAELFK